MRGAQAIFAAVLLLGAAATSAGAAGRPVFTQRDSGRAVELRLGRTAVVRLPRSYARTALRATGTSVLVVRVDYASAPGFREWELRAVRRGTTTLRAKAGERRFVLDVRVVS